MNPGHKEVLGPYTSNPLDDTDTGYTLYAMWCPKCQMPLKMGTERCEYKVRKGKQMVDAGCGGPLNRKGWTVAAVENGTKGQFEQFIQDRARLPYLELENRDPVEASKMRALYMADFAAGAYRWEGRNEDESDGILEGTLVNHVQVAKTQTYGVVYLTYLCAKRCNKNLTLQEFNRVFLAVGHEEFIRAWLWCQELSGNSQAPATTSQPTGAEGVNVPHEGLKKEMYQVPEMPMANPMLPATSYPPTQKVFQD